MKKITFSIITILLSILGMAQSDTHNIKVVFGTIQHSGPYDRSDILLQSKLNVSSGAYTITSYHLTILPTTGKPQRFEIIGKHFPPILTNALNQITSGDSIIISSVKATSLADSLQSIMLLPITLRVKGGANHNFSKGAAQPPTATFGDITTFTTSYPLAEILEQNEIGVNSKEVAYTITKFKLIIVPKNQPPLLFSGSGPTITAKMKDKIAQLKSGDRILVESISSYVLLGEEKLNAHQAPIILSVR